MSPPRVTVIHNPVGSEVEEDVFVHIAYADRPHFMGIKREKVKTYAAPKSDGRLRQARIAAGMTMLQLADELGITIPQLSNIEWGGRAHSLSPCDEEAVIQWLSARTGGAS